MIDSDTKNYVDNAISNAQQQARFSTTNSSYHTHNGVDSPKLDTTSLVAGVSQIVAGSNISVNPSDGIGVVTVSSSSSVSSVSGTGVGILVSPTTGSVLVQNTGVTSLSAGANISLSGTTGAIVVSASSGGALGFGDGSDGDVTLTHTTTLTRDMFYHNLTVNAGVFVLTKSFRIFCTGTLDNEGTILNNGNNASGTTGGAAVVSGSLPGTVAGQNGGGAVTVTNNNTSNGTVGTAGTSVAKSIGSAGTASGASGEGAISGGSGSGQPSVAGGSQTGTVFNVPKTFTAAYNLFDTQPSSTFAAFTLSGGSAGGASGGAATQNFGVGSCNAVSGAGGGAGSPGGIVWLAAATLINNGIIQALGGNGANGGNGTVSASGSQQSGAGGGAGGGAGAGGVIVLIYTTLSGSGTTDVSAGTPGSGGTGAGFGFSSFGNPGTAGATGNAGVTYSLFV